MLDPIAMGVIETPDTTNKNKVVPHWKILGLTAEYLANHKIDVDILDAKNKKVYTESVNPDGTFNYRKLDSDKSYIFKLREGAEPLCDELEIVLLDENGNEAGKTVRDDKCKFTFNKKPNTTTVDNPPLAVGPTSYEKHYHYNRTGVDKDFNRFINDLVNIIKANGVVYIDIESSASKVPTTTYGDNDNLAKARLKEAKQKILAALAAKGISADKVKFVSETSLEQGPEYNDDWNTNREVYEKYQYIRIKAK
jgi:hypothetical protein